MITQIAYYCSVTPGEMSTFMVDIKDDVNPSFRISIICGAHQMFFPSMLMSGVVAMDLKSFTPSSLAVRIKNQLEEKMQMLNLTWSIIRDDDNEVALMAVEE